MEVFFMKETNNKKILLSVREVATILGCSVSYAYDLIEHGFIPHIKLRTIKVRPSAIDEFLEKYENHDLSDLNNVRRTNLKNTNTK